MRSLTDEEKKTVEDNLALIYSILSKMNLPKDLYSDAFQCSCFGLIDAVKRFDPNRGTQFGTFATWQIKKSLTNYFRNENFPQVVSGNVTIKLDGNEVELFDSIPDDCDLLSDIITNEGRERLNKYLSKILNWGEIKVVIMKFFLGCTNDEIGREFGISHQAIHKRISKIKKKIREHPEIEDVFNDFFSDK